MWGAMLALALITVAAALIGGCTKTVYLPTESAASKTDTIAVMRWRTDTVVDRDTVTLTQRGDTILLESTKWRWRVRETHDTVYQSKADSVYIEKPCPVEVVKEVERKRSWWETALLWTGGIAVALSAFLAARRYRQRT